MEEPKAYRGKITYALPLLVIPTLFTLAVFADTGLSNSTFLVFLVFFWILFLLPFFLALGYRLEVGNGFVRNTFLGFRLFELYSKQVESATYGGVALWGSIYPGSNAVVHGKGLAILGTINGKSNVYGISEKLYGKHALNHVIAVLEIKIPKIN